MKDLTPEQFLAVKAILEKYPEHNRNLEEDTLSFCEWALDQGMSKCLHGIKEFYKSTADKSYFLKCLDVIRVFYPEVDSPLADVMQEEE